MKLSNIPIFFLDLQTTGARPSSGQILEIAFVLDEFTIESFLVSLPEGQDIPRRIQLITGIQQHDMNEAISLEEIKTKIKKYQDRICVIHYAQFEKPFLAHALGENSNNTLQIICTHEIAKRLYPNIPSRGIKALAGFFGHGTGDFKRAKCHAMATMSIWKELVKSLADINIFTLDELNSWLEQTPKVSRTKLEYPLSKEKRLALPDCPGIYRMKNKKGEILYIGKATSLHQRVNSYFRGQKNRDAKKLEMLAQIYDIEITVCKSPLHAALLETDEIKKNNPYYNIALKTNARTLFFFSKDFQSAISVMDETHSVGPFSSLLPLDSTLKLTHYCQNQETMLLPPHNLFFDEIEPALIKEGIDEFIKRHHITMDQLSSYRRVLALGLLWLRRLKIKSDEDIHDEVELHIEAEDEIALTSFDIADKLERHFIRAAQAYLRAKKINELTNATILYSELEKETQKIVIKGGEIVDEGSPKSPLNPWLKNSIMTYDRISVLLTELEKIRTQGGQWTKIS